MITEVLPGSPADGKLNKGQILENINGTPIPEGFWEHRKGEEGDIGVYLEGLKELPTSK